MNINSIQNSQQNFSSLKIRVKDNGESSRKMQIETLKSELPALEQMPEADLYNIKITGKGSDTANDSWEDVPAHLAITVKRPGLFKKQNAYLTWYNQQDGTIQDTIKRAIGILHEKESRKNNGIDFNC